MDWMRQLRHWCVRQTLSAAVRTAPRLREHTIDSFEAAFAWGAAHAPILARIVADNMKTLGVYSPQQHREHFRHMAAQVIGWLRTVRCISECDLLPSGQAHPNLIRVAEQYCYFDESVETFVQTASLGRGVILAGTHLGSPPCWLLRLNQHVPTTAYIRFSKDPGRRAVKERTFRPLGVEFFAEPAAEGPRGARLARLADILRRGRAIVITPDLARRRGEGTPIRMFGREFYIPSGPAVLAVLTGAPLMMLTGHRVGPRVCLHIHGPFTPTEPDGTPDSQEGAIQQRIQWFAGLFEQTLRQDPALWQLWADNRWTRAFRGDPKYVTLHPEEEAPIQ